MQNAYKLNKRTKYPPLNLSSKIQNSISPPAQKIWTTLQARPQLQQAPASAPQSLQRRTLLLKAFNQRVKNIHPWNTCPRAGGWESSISCRKATFCTSRKWLVYHSCHLELLHHQGSIVPKYNPGVPPRWSTPLHAFRSRRKYLHFLFGKPHKGNTYFLLDLVANKQNSSSFQQSEPGRLPAGKRSSPTSRMPQSTSNRKYETTRQKTRTQ